MLSPVAPAIRPVAYCRPVRWRPVFAQRRAEVGELARQGRGLGHLAQLQGNERRLSRRRFQVGCPGRGDLESPWRRDLSPGHIPRKRATPPRMTCARLATLAPRRPRTASAACKCSSAGGVLALHGQDLAEDTPCASDNPRRRLCGRTEAEQALQPRPSFGVEPSEVPQRERAALASRNPSPGALVATPTRAPRGGFPGRVRVAQRARCPGHPAPDLLGQPEIPPSMTTAPSRR